MGWNHRHHVVSETDRNDLTCRCQYGIVVILEKNATGSSNSVSASIERRDSAVYEAAKKACRGWAG